MDGTISSRSAASAAFEVESVPLPSTGIETFATVFAALTSTSIGSFMTPGGQCAPLELADRLLDGGRLDVRRLDHDARRDLGAREGRLDAVVAASGTSAESVSMLAWAVCSWSAGTARATSSPPASAAESTGRRSTRSMIAPQIRPSPSLRRSRWTNGTRTSVDAVAELGEQRREHRQRPEHRDRDHCHRRDGERRERRRRR